MPSSTIQRISLMDEGVSMGDHSISPAGSTDPKLSGTRPNLIDVERIGLAGDRLVPSGNGNGGTRDNLVERRFSALCPDLVEQAIWIAGQLRSSLEPNVVLERSQEVLDLIYERCSLMCRHMKLFIPPEIRRDFYAVVVNELIGFEPLEPPLNKDQRMMEK